MYSFSREVNSLHASDIKQLMKHTTLKDVISFAGGMPNNDLFPVKEIDEIYGSLSNSQKKIAFQYGATSGYEPLRISLKTYLNSKNLPVNDNNILVTTGSLQAISIITQEFVNSGDYILTEYPCFVGALSVFETYGASILSVPLDEEGIDIERLKYTIQNAPKKPKFLYVTPNFHNPAGIIYSLKRKQELLKVLENTGIILLEDDAYNELYFSDKVKLQTQPMKSMKNNKVEIVYTGSFSKILGPGFRLGWMLASDEIFQKAESIKQALDACTSNFTQLLANEFLSKGYLKKYVGFLRSEYAERAFIMHNSLLKYMPKYVTWQKPKGGFYIWLKLPKKMNSTLIFNKCIEKSVLFLTGRTFDPESIKDNCLRLSFSNTPKDLIDEGIKKLALVITKINN